jgi:hypothetical protein
MRNALHSADWCETPAVDPNPPSSAELAAQIPAVVGNPIHVARAGYNAGYAKGVADERARVGSRATIGEILARAACAALGREFEGTSAQDIHQAVDALKGATLDPFRNLVDEWQEKASDMRDEGYCNPRVFLDEVAGELIEAIAVARKWK